jgi:hypothetical protein
MQSAVWIPSNTRLVGHQAIALQHRSHLVALDVFCLDPADQRGMNLAQRNQSQDVLAFGHGVDQQFPIGSHDLPVVRIGKTQIEIEFPGFAGVIDGCSPADSGTKPVHEPSQAGMPVS